MNVAKMISILCDAASSVTQQLDSWSGRNAHAETGTMTPGEYLGISCASDVVRDLFRALPDDFTKPNKDLFDSFYLHMHKDGKNSEGQDIHKMREYRKVAGAVHGVIYKLESDSRKFAQSI